MLEYYTEHIGSTVSFSTYNESHNVTITGEVVAICDSTMATMIMDIANYHSQVQQSTEFSGDDASNLRDVTQMDFIVIESDSGNRAAYGIDWIDSSTYEVVTDTGTVDIRLFNVSTSDVTSVMESIALKGVSAKVVTT